MKFTLDELVFLKAHAFYRLDMLKDMQAIGISKADTECIVFTDSIKNTDIVQWWIDYGKTELGPIMLEYLSSKLNRAAKK
jgi:hypothetical protein